MTEINTLSESEVASVGEIGTTVRGDRIYHNATVYHQTMRTVHQVVTDMLDISTDGSDGSNISRAVFRGIVSPNAMDEIAGSWMAPYLEAGVQLKDYGEVGWLAYLAINFPGREPILPIQAMIQETDGYHIPASSTSAELTIGVKHDNQIPDSSINDLTELWQPFDWTSEGIRQRAQRIAQNLAGNPQERDTWFSGLWHSEQLICAATAERLTYVGSRGNFELVESTEWSTRADVRRSGRSLMAHNLRLLNHEIQLNLGNANGKTPLIFAETNYATRADRAGRRAGFVIPAREPYNLNQMILQNVPVNDGLEPSGRWRDFTLLVVPPSQRSAI